MKAAGKVRKGRLFSLCTWIGHQPHLYPGTEVRETEGGKYLIYNLHCERCGWWYRLKVEKIKNV